MNLFQSRHNAWLFIVPAILLVCVLRVPAYAQVGTGWAQTNPTKKIHLDDWAGLQTFNWTSYKSVALQDGSGIAADYTYNSSTSTETFRIFSTESNRSEIRLYNDYTSGIWQFEGYVTFDTPLNDESLFQIFGSTTGATFAMVRGYSENNGTIKVNGNVLATNIYGQQVRINIIHQEDVGAKFYVNGVYKATIIDDEYANPDGSPVSNYWKYGCYGTTHGLYPTVVWQSVRTFGGGYAPNLPSGVWMTDAAVSWGNTANWSTNVIADGINSIADFSQTNITSNRTITLDSPRTVGTIKFADSMNEGSPATSKSYTIDSATNALTLQTSTGNPVIDVIYGQSHSINSILAGTQGFTKTGPGTLRLGGTGANTIAGPIQINGGTIRADKSTAFNGQSITLADGTQVYHNVAGTFSSTYNIKGMGVLESDGITRFGGLRIGTNGVVISGTVNLTGDSAISARLATTTGATVSGRITGSHALKFNHTSSTTSPGNGILVISNTGNDWTGNTTISDGTLKIGASGVIPNGPGKGNVTLIDEGTTGAADTVLDLNGFNETINGLLSSGTILSKLKITNSGGAAAKLTLGDYNASSSFGGILSDGTSQLALDKIGAGTQSLSGTNTYTGGTTLSGGILSVSSTGNLGGASSSLTFNGGKLAATGAVALARPINIMANGGGINTAGNIVSLTGAQNTTWGAGTLTVDGTSGGKLLLNRSGGTVSVISNAILQINAGATVDLNGASATYDGSANALKIVNNAGGTLLVSGTNQTVGAITGSGSTIVNNGATLTAKSIVGNTLTIGVGSKFALAPLPGGPLAGYFSPTPVPEPSCIVLLFTIGLPITLFRIASRR